MCEVFTMLYEEIRDKFKIRCLSIKEKFDEDIFHDTLLKFHLIIKEHPHKNHESYLWTSFRNNMKREKMYARNKNRIEIEDMNIDVMNEEYDYEKDQLHENVMEDIRKKFGHFWYKIFLQHADGVHYNELSLAHNLQPDHIKTKYEEMFDYIRSKYDGR